MESVRKFAVSSITAAKTLEHRQFLFHESHTLNKAMIDVD
jgi:hypothetical protein